MTKDEIIASLLDQLKDDNNRIIALAGRVNELLAKVAELTAIIKSLREEKGAKEKDLNKANNKIKGMGKLLGKENEQQVEKPQLTDEEKKVLDEARSIRRKARGMTRPGASAGRPVATTAPRETSMRSARWNTRMFIRTIRPSTSSRHIRWKR